MFQSNQHTNNPHVISKGLDMEEDDSKSMEEQSPMIAKSTWDIASLDEVVENQELNNVAKREKPYASSLHILKDYKNRFRKLDINKVQQMKDTYKTNTCITPPQQKLSTGAILRMASESFIQFSSQNDSESSAISHPYAYSFAGLTQEDIKAVQLVQYLLASAEKVGNKQFFRAGKFLIECDKGISSEMGTPIERLVHYFSGALQERIDRETGTFTQKGLGSKQCRNMLQSMEGLTPDIIAMQKHVPFAQVTQLAGIQAILDHVADSTKIHIVDLEIRTGMHYTILMQALATRSANPVKYVKITAVGTKSRAKIEETRDRLLSFAQTLNMKLFFNIVMVDHITHLHQTLFDIRPDEETAVWIEFYLMFLLSRQEALESLVRVVRALNPRIMILTEVEGNNNSPVFVTRFIESLFHYGGFFECLEDCLKHDPKNRKYIEYVYLSQAIRNIVAAEGEERTIRHVGVQVWRSFFARFGLVQAELSMSSMYQAKLVLGNFACGKSCTLDLDGKSLIVGWNGTPIHSLSAWKAR